ncbi:MAG: hypothetical protein P1T08_13435 [Acidimicrobiia bacterium]|nr:hypothetical protein [Acidimicrobiia bacterium]
MRTADPLAGQALAARLRSGLTAVAVEREADLATGIQLTRLLRLTLLRLAQGIADR